MKLKGFFSSLFLLYLIMITSIIYVQTYVISTQLLALENLQLVFDDNIALSNAKDDLYCRIYNHQDLNVLTDTYSINGTIDYDSNSGEASVCTSRCILLEFSYDSLQEQVVIHSIKH